MSPYRAASYPDKEPVQVPSLREVFSKKWSTFYDSTRYIRSEKWIILFFVFCFVYMLLAGFVYSIVSYRYFLTGSLFLSAAYVLTVLLCLGSAILSTVIVVKIARNKL